MIQQLLRGRIFYILFGALVLLLYLRAVTTGVGGDPTGDSRLIEGENATAWWTQPRDLSILREAVAADSRIGLILAILSLSLLIIAFTVGGLLVTSWGLWTGRLRDVWRFPTPPRSPWSFGELSRIAFLAIAVACLMPFVRLALLYYESMWTLDAHLWVTVSMLVLDVLVVFAVLAFAEGKAKSVWMAFGMSRRNLWRSIKTGLLGYLTVFPWLFLMLFLVVEVSRRVGYEPPLEPIHRLIFEEHRPGVLALTVLLACGVGPMAEEFFFRGVVYSAIRRKSSRLLAMLISGALFSLTHTNVVGFLPIMLLGSLLAYLYERTGSLIAPMTVHALHNTLLFGVAAVFRQLVPFS